MNGFQKIWFSEKSVFCLIVILLSCLMSILLKNVAPFVAATAIVAPVWTFVKAQVNVAAIRSGLEGTMNSPTITQGMQTPPSTPPTSQP